MNASVLTDLCFDRAPRYMRRAHKEIAPIMHKRLAPPEPPSGSIDLMTLSKEALISQIADLTFSLRVLESRAVAAEGALEDLRSRLKAMIERME